MLTLMISFVYVFFDLQFNVMKSVLINFEKKSDIALIVSLARKLGMTAKQLTRSEVEDWKFAQRIDAGMKSSTISRQEVMKALGK